MISFKQLSSLGLCLMVLDGCQRLSPPSASSSFRYQAQNEADPFTGLEGLKGDSLLSRLNSIIARHKSLGYNEARDQLFNLVDDPNNNNTVECLYTGRVLTNVTNRQSAFKGGDGMNTEHTWPQSLGAVGEAQSDLHHLFATDVKANGRRDSHPFGDVVSVKWQEGGSQLGTNTNGNLVFEPRDNKKGDVARAVLYFYTVYGNRNTTNTNNFKQEKQILKQWHAQDPADQLERAREDRVFKLQGNHNPYILHPELVARGF
jgi:deoxyribonuclease I